MKMNEVILTFWILFWVIFLIMSIVEKRGIVFGFLAGLWILFLGVYLYIDGLEWQTGASIVTSGASQQITFQYSQVVAPFSNYGLLWAVPFILLGIYVTYLAVTKKRGETVG
jgi:hypothetical protein